MNVMFGIELYRIMVPVAASLILRIAVSRCSAQGMGHGKNIYSRGVYPGQVYESPVGKTTPSGLHKKNLKSKILNPKSNHNQTGLFNQKFEAVERHSHSDTRPKLSAVSSHLQPRLNSFRIFRPFKLLILVIITTSFGLTRSVNGQNISGRVFEDVNYGGGIGRDFVASSGSLRENARVELYDSTGSFVSATTTDAAGDYTFTALSPGDYTVRIVNDTVTSSRPGFVVGLLPVQTFRTGASSGTAVAVTDKVGGETPSLVDAGSNTTGATLASLTTATTTAQSISPVTISTTDVTDVDFGFNFDTIVNTNDSGAGSIRQFILNSNALDNTGLAQVGLTAGVETSVFMIPGTGDALGRPVDPNFNASGNSEFTITPTSILPEITDTVILDGTTQAEFTTTPIIELDGFTIPAGSNPGLHIAGSGANTSRISGFVIHSSPGQGIFIDNTDDVSILGNYIGTDVAGTVDLGNGDSGIQVSAGSGVIIGGVNATDLNLVSGNEGHGILLGSHTGGTIQGNYVGVDINATSGLGNGEDGIHIFFGSGNQIGGTTVAARNIVSANFTGGIFIRSSSDNIIENNYIGTDVNGTAALGNIGNAGVFIQGNSPDNRVGGSTANAANIIAFNTGDGIGSSNSITQNNTFIGNSIHSNSQLGIDLASDDVTVNDSGDADTGSNSKLNFPELLSVVQNGASLDINFSLDVPAGDYRIEFFDNPGGLDSSLHGEGQTFIGATTISHTGSGVESFSDSLTFTASNVRNITSTTTEDLGGSFGSTSEFGGSVSVDFGDAPDSYGTDSTDAAGEGIGASHGIDSRLYIGPTVPDADNDGFVDGTDDTGNAGDDDATAAPGNGADEGGISLAALTVTDTSYSIDVDVVNTNNSTVTLIAWIDFDLSGTFDADEEAMLTGVLIGTQTLSWNTIPTDITVGTTYVRLRLSTDNLTENDATGMASSGEVEDYQLSINGRISGIVWNDEDFDGIREVGESMLDGVQVDLFDASDVLQETTVTVSGGLYEFSSVSPGDYSVEFTPLANFVLTRQNQGNDDDLDSDPKPVTNNTGAIRVDGSTVNDNWDAGMLLDSDIDFITDITEGTGDRDGDGNENNLDFDPTGYFYDEANGEIIAGGLISITGPGQLDLRFDGSTGFYQWIGETPGVYTMTITTPPGYALSDACPLEPPTNVLDPTGGPDPTVVGAFEEGSTGFLQSTMCTTTFVAFDFEPGDPVVINNNIALKNLSTDYGDAPNSYATLGSSNGARHTIDSDLFIGPTVPDADTDGFVDGTDDTTNAGDDDAAAVPGNGADEGGVALSALTTTDTNYSVTVDVTNTNNSAVTLIGWIDFDQSGTFDADEEAILNGVLTGAQILSWNPIPGDIAAGATYARFRLSTDSLTENDPAGAASDGEVEDYQLVITATGTSSIAGRVFEDINYGGGSGRDYTTADASAQASGWAADAVGSGPGVIVELYQNQSGNFIKIADAATDGNGTYTFSPITNGTYRVRVVNGTVISNRGSSVPIGVQTFRNDPDSGGPVTTEVGGASPTLVDSVTQANGTDLSTITAQSVTEIVAAGAAISGVDFGFNFDTIVNTNDSGQGSLRQFLINSNELTNTNLDQATNGTFDPAAGDEVSIFMIPNGDLDGRGVASISINTQLPTITDPSTHIDGRTQTANIGDTNTGTLGDSTTLIGVTGTTLSGISAPEIEIVDGNSVANGLTIAANDSEIRQVGIYGFGSAGTEANISVSSSVSFGMVIDQNVIGASADSFTAPGDRGQVGAIIEGSNGTLSNNLIGFAGRHGLVLNGASATGWVISDNELRGNSAADGGDNIVVDGGAGSNLVRQNLITEAAAFGLDVFDSAGGNTFQENTISDNGQIGTTEDGGVRLGAHNDVLNSNRIFNNAGSGVTVYEGAGNGDGNLITQNHIFDNGKIGIDLIAQGGNSGLGTVPYVTQNDDSDGDEGGNQLLNFPVFERAELIGPQLILTGFAPANATIELFIADSAPNPNPNPFSLDFGEGETFLQTLREGSAFDTDTSTGSYTNDSGSETTANRFSFIIATPPGVSVDTRLTATATVSTNTSEFSGVVTVTTASGSAFVCDGTFYISSGPSSSQPVTLRTVDTNQNPFGLPAIGDDSHGITYNATAYNPVDNFLYAIRRRSQEILRIGTDGVPQSLGNATGLSATNYNAGDVDANGFYFLKRGGNNNELSRVNLNSASFDVTNITLSQRIRITDWAFSPIDGMLYTIIQGGRMAQINPTTGAVTQIGPDHNLGTIGATYFDIDGNLYGYENRGAFYRFDTTTGERTFLSTAPQVSINDGASCPAEVGMNVVVGAAKDLNLSGAGPWTVTLDYYFENFGDDRAFVASAADDLESHFGTPGVDWTFAGITNITGTSGFDENTVFDGETAGDSELVLSGSSLGPVGSGQERAQIRVVIQVVNPVTVCNQITFSVETINGAIVTDLSVPGTDPDANGNGDPTDDNDCTQQTVAPEITGTVFEDFNYGGGPGRDFSTADASAEASGFSVGAIGSGSGVVVELYENQSGNFIKIDDTVTDADGNYSFSNIADGTYRVRVVNDTVISSRSSNGTGIQPLAVQTFRNDPDSGGAVTNEVGGANPTAMDTPGTQANGTDLSTITAQSVTEVVIAGSGAIEVDFGFNFDTIVNRNDSGQGSLRQFIFNSNELGNTNLDQEANISFDPGNGEEVSIFMIPSGDLDGRGVASISISSQLPAIIDTSTHVDGRTQTAGIGDTNSGTLGDTTTAIGVAGTTLIGVLAPEVELIDNGNVANGLTINANGVEVRQLAIFGFGSSAFDGNINVTGSVSSGLVIDQNVIGTAADTFSAPADRGSIGVVAAGGNGVLSNNLIGHAGGHGLVLFTNNAHDWDVRDNEFRGNSESDGGDNIVIDTAAAVNTVQRNLIVEAAGFGIDILSTGGNNVLEQNTISDNGQTGITEDGGVRLGGENDIARLNVISDNAGSGVIVHEGSGTGDGNLISQNHIFDNGKIGIDLIEQGGNAGLGTTPFVTQNDNGDGDEGGNGLINFPVFESASISGGNLTLTGFAPAGADIELFIADAGPNPNPNPFSLDFGEGATYLVTVTEGSYLVTVTEGSAADTESTSGGYSDDSGTEANAARFSFTIPTPSGVTTSTHLTATATVANNTSEFSGTITFSLIDFGDASDTYGTDSTDDGGEGIGASHIIDSNLFIGPTVPDADANGFVDGTDDTVNASDDDAATAPGNGADEGGIIFGALTTGDTTYSVNVDVFNNTGSDAYLVGWIDFDGSGFFDTDEGIIYDSDTGTAGTQPIGSSGSIQNLTLTWSDMGCAGPDIVDGTTYARFRLSTDTNVAGGGTNLAESTPTGAASDGEVEDYELTISPEVCAPSGGLVINEASNGSAGGEEWVELLVIGDPANPTDPVNVDGWIIDDNNGEFEGTTGTGLLTGHLFLDDTIWQSIDPGSLIVIYRQSEKDPLIPADDPTDSDGDGVYILPGNHSSLSQCDNLPSASNVCYTPCTVAAPSWPTQYRNSGDVVQVRPPGGCFFHGYAYGDVDVSTVAPMFPSGNATWNIGTGGTGSTFIFHCGDWEDQANFERADLSSGTTRSPGSVNSVDNNTFISKIIDGSLDYSDLNNAVNCTITLTMDYGDALDTYGTDSTDDGGEGIGASHIIDSNLFIGPTVPDADANGFVDGTDDTGNAGDDDAAAAPGNGADEGGIIFGALTTGDTTYSVNVDVFNNTGSDAYLVGWVDFDGSGGFDADEGVVFDSDDVTAGIQPIVSSASLQNLRLTWTNIGGSGTDIIAGTTFARLRLSTDADVAGGGTNLTVNTPIGPASDGEVEDYQVTIAQALDFGDAPDDLSSLDSDLANTYPTLLADNGARHIIDGVAFLGSAVDGETEGQPTFDADGDDSNGADDDDGVTFPTLATTPVLFSEENNGVSIVASVDGVLNAWVDFNQDGDWADAGEQVATDVALTTGNNSISIFVDDVVPHGQTYARFRFSTSSGLLVTGEAPDGEVEDYRVHIIRRRPTDIFCGNRLLDASFEEPITTGPTPAIASFVGGTIKIYRESVVPGWAFASTNPNAGSNFDRRNSIELWRSGALGVPAFEGSQFAEINGFVFGNLYQDFETSPGEVLNWRFAHRGRNGTDTLSLSLGPPGATVSQATFSTGNTAWRVYSGTYTVPAGQFITRMQFEAISSAGGNPGVGNFIDVVSINACDYSDAPNSYTVTTASGGPRHQLAGELFMGSDVDFEEDGLTSADASGDDTNDRDDEDGVLNFPTLADTTTSYSVDVTVTNDSSDSANLIGWIDFDLNGTFDIDEAAIVSVAGNGADNGAKTLTWSPIPSDITAGTSFARFRLTTDTSISAGTPGGSAENGEVEDYLITIETGCAVTLRPADDGDVAAGGTTTFNHTVVNPTGSNAFIRIDMVTPTPALSYTFIANGDSTWFIDGGDGIIQGGGVGDDTFIAENITASFGTVFTQLAPDASANFRIEVAAPSSVALGTIDTVDFRALLDVDGNFSGTGDQCAGTVTDTATVIEGSCTIDISPPLSGQVSPGGSTTYTHTVINGSDFTGFVRIDLVVATSPALSYTFIAEGDNWQLIGANGDAETSDTFMADGDSAPFNTVFIELESQASATFRVNIHAASSVSSAAVDAVDIRAFMDLDGDYDGTTDDQCDGSVTDVTSVSEGFLKLGKDASVADTHTFNSINGTCSAGADGATGGPCDTITYTLTYKNLGVQDAIDVTVTDQIPVNTTYVGGSVDFDGDCDGIGGDVPNAGDTAVFDAINDAVIWTLSQPVVPGEEGCLIYEITINGE